MPIKPIRADEDLLAAFRRLERIYQADEGTPAADERDVLVTLVEAYENQHYAFGPADRVEAIKFRMEQQGLIARDLKPTISSASTHSGRDPLAEPVRSAPHLIDGVGMPRNAVIVPVFVASPADVSDERALLETVITQLNQVWSKSLGVIFELVRWETHTRPSFSIDPQAAINEQIGSEYDVFIGIFWGRLGTPTPRSESGSVEEFERAYSRFSETKSNPEIMIYFKDAAIPPSKIDPGQLERLQSFKNSLSARGGLYSIFEDQPGFESSLRAHLSALAQKFAQQAVSKPPQELPPTVLAVAHLLEDEEDDYGYIDYMEIYEARMTDMTSSMEIMNQAIVRIGEQIAIRNSELNPSVLGSTKETRKIMKRTADDMLSFSDIVSNQLPILTIAREGAFRSLSNALALHSDFGGKMDELGSLRMQLTNMNESAVQGRDGLLSMRASSSSLPRISKELNQAKRVMVSRLDLIVTELDNIVSTVTNIIEAIDRMIGGPSRLS